MYRQKQAIMQARAGSDVVAPSGMDQNESYRLPKHSYMHRKFIL